MSTGSTVSASHEHAAYEGEIRSVAKLVAGGSLGEFVGGAGAVVLSIIGLAHLFPSYMVGIAALGIGGALILQGGAVAARYRSILAETTGDAASSVEFTGGMTTEFMGGCAGVVLGILSLLGVVPAILMPVAALVYGGTLIMSCGTTARLNMLSLGPDARPLVRQIARDAVQASASAQAFVGGGAIVLGIIALVGYSPTELVLISFLAVGAAVLLSGAAVGGRMWSLFHYAE